MAEGTLVIDAIGERNKNPQGSAREPLFNFECPVEYFAR
jgi:hypothetical protein